MFYNCLAAPSQGRRNERVPLRVRPIPADDIAGVAGIKVFVMTNLITAAFFRSVPVCPLLR